MKRLFLVLAIVILLQGIGNAELSQETKKYQVVYTLTYNAISLEEAGKIEMMIQRLMKEACILKTEVGKVVPTTISFFNGEVFPNLPWGCTLPMEQCMANPCTDPTHPQRD